MDKIIVLRKGNHLAWAGLIPDGQEEAVPEGIEWDVKNVFAQDTSGEWQLLAEEPNE